MFLPFCRFILIIRFRSIYYCWLGKRKGVHHGFPFRELLGTFELYASWTKRNVSSNTGVCVCLCRMSLHKAWSPEIGRKPWNAYVSLHLERRLFAYFAINNIQYHFSSNFSNKIPCWPVIPLFFILHFSWLLHPLATGQIFSYHLDTVKSRFSRHSLLCSFQPISRHIYKEGTVSH